MQEIWRRRAAQGLAHIASPEPLLAEHFKHPLAHEPGSHSSYSNTGFVVLSAVIEESDRQALRDLLPGGGVRAARHRERAAASGLAAVLGRARLDHRRRPTTSPSSMCSTRSIRFSATG